MKLYSFVIAIVFGTLLSGCGGGGGGSSSTGGGDTNQPPVSVTKALLSLLVSPAAAAEIPNGAVATVKVQGNDVDRTVTLTDVDVAAEFSDLLLGTYTVTVSVTNNGVEIGTFSETVLLSEGGESIDASIVFNRASLSVEPFVSSNYAAINHEYEGRSTVSSECLGDAPFSTDATTATVEAEGANITITFDNFYGETLQLSGVIDDSTGSFLASGTFQSSDFKQGNWNITYLSKQTERSITIAASFENATDTCNADYEFVGIY